MIVFFVSLVGITLLFTLKKIEAGREQHFAEGMRTSADHGALRVKAWLEMSESYLERTPFFIAALARYGIHVGALAFARLARTSAEQAHRLADVASHKRNFERRETRSEFMKQVGEHPIRNQNGSNGASKNRNGIQGGDNTRGQL